ncbi:hypothetical protein BJY22_006261 [Kribbella shirazensis]|uniref:Uncharacterized protein n=1 Tax=Kribbella shirazensis TaxID=1105143 RepID=A0A7X6A4P9_9ACTN|nr:hypothetical protein [Kribbella shirazensis]
MRTQAITAIPGREPVRCGLRHWPSSCCQVVVPAGLRTGD